MPSGAKRRKRSTDTQDAASAVVTNGAAAAVGSSDVSVESGAPSVPQVGDRVLVALSDDGAAFAAEVATIQIDQCTFTARRLVPEQSETPTEEHTFTFTDKRCILATNLRVAKHRKSCVCSLKEKCPNGGRLIKVIVEPQPHALGLSYLRRLSPRACNCMHNRSSVSPTNCCTIVY